MTESIQKRLTRVRPPRVRITYDVETGGAMEKEELPFIVGILADLQGDRPEDDGDPAPLAQRPMHDIDRDSFDDVMRKIKPGVAIDRRLPDLKGLGDDDAFLGFHSMADFEPLNVVQALPTLRRAYLARNQVRWLQGKAETDAKVAELLQRWLGFEIAADDPSTPILRARLRSAFEGPAAEDRIAAVRKALPVLADTMAAYRVAHQAHDDAPGDDTRKALDSATDAALAALKAWGLVEVKNAREPVTRDTVLRWGSLLASSLALDATPENEKTAERHLKALAEEEAPKDKARQEAAAGQRASLASLDMATRDHAMGQALLAAGLARAASRDAVHKPEHLEIAAVAKKYESDCVEAESRGLYLQVLAAIYRPDAEAAKDAGGTQDAGAAADAAEDAEAAKDAGAGEGAQGGAASEEPAPGTDSAAAPGGDEVLARALFTMVELLRPSRMLAVPAIVYRLYSFVTEVMKPWQEDDASLHKARKQGIGAVIDQRVAQIDARLSVRLSAIMHQQAFRKLEASWRGLRYLVFRTETGAMLKLKVLNASKGELRKDMEGAVEFDQSALFKMIYEAEYGTFGGFPYSLLVGDYEIGGSGEDIAFVQKMAEVAASAHVPFIAAASAQLFGLESFDALALPRDLAKIFESKELESWHEFRAMEDSRYVSLVLPRILLRLPYGRPDKRNTIACEGLNFEEQVAPRDELARYSPQDPSVALSYPRPDTANFLWGNAAWVLAERITNAFALYGWTAAIRGVEGGGLVEGLPLYSYTSDAGSTELFCPTEVAITDRREKELSDLGFMSLCHCKGTSNAAFFGGQTTNSPKSYFSPDANANARLSSMLPYMLAASRFAHYIKVIMRKKVGMFMTRANVESYLNNWISHYVLLDDNAPQEAKAAFPLRAANVIVTEVPGEPGRYNATVFLKPHFQLEELSTSIRLVATLPA